MFYQKESSTSNLTSVNEQELKAMNYKYGVCSGLLGEQRTRWMPYQEKRDLEGRLKIASKIRGLDGVEVGYPGDFQSPGALKSLLEKYELEVAAVNLKVRGPSFMYKGSFSSPEKQAVDTAIKWGKEALDAAADCGCGVVTTCPLNDGFDYPFEVEYGTAWDGMVSGISSVASHRSDINLAIEYKLSDPRTRSLVSNVGEALLLARQTEKSNVGVNLDFGHCLIARENPAMSVAMAVREKRLFHVHLNDNDRVADIDLATGTIHYWETLEFLWYLKEYGYQGWLVTDVYPKENDVAEVFSRTIELQKRYLALTEKIDDVDFSSVLRERNVMNTWKKMAEVLA